MINEIDADFPEEDKLTLEDKLQVLSVWQEMQMNAFNSVPIVLAEDVSWSSVIKIETRLITLDGISVAVENQRVYPKGRLPAISWDIRARCNRNRKFKPIWRRDISARIRLAWTVWKLPWRIG